MTKRTYALISKRLLARLAKRAVASLSLRYTVAAFHKGGDEQQKRKGLMAGTRLAHLLGDLAELAEFYR